MSWNGSFFYILVFFASVAASADDLNSHKLYNKTAFIPPQCYKKTDFGDHVENPCFVCHINGKHPNFIDDSDLQKSYDLQSYSLQNRWSNLFLRKTISHYTKEHIEKYVHESNYKDQNNNLILSKKLSSVPFAWDSNRNSKWDGYIPDVMYEVNSDGIDSKNGAVTGWINYGYDPLPGFMAVDGSIGDAFIRLPKEFRQDRNKKYSSDTYLLNIAILEAIIKQENVPITGFSEKNYGVDLDGDGVLTDSPKEIRFKANIASGEGMHYVGYAGTLQDKNKITVAAGLYPVGTEFFHSVRYLALSGSDVVMAPRMKEIRYAKKIGETNYDFHRRFSISEAAERVKFPNNIPMVEGDFERGVMNGLGWLLQGFIEDSAGNLRPQSYEEHVFCVGCHSALGRLTDSTFSFARKNKIGPYTTKSGYSYISDKGADELDLYRKNNSSYEIDFEDPEGTVSKLNAAYMEVVKKQSFKYGRDANYESSSFHFRNISPNKETGIKDIIKNK